MRTFGLFILYLFVLLSCKEEKVKEKPEVDWTKKESTDLNKELAIRENIDIKLYIERHASWKMEETGSGLYYFIYKNGEGAQATASREAQVQFEINLLDGTPCYKTEEDEVEEFKIDHSHVETGIHEAIKLMREGDRAKLIVPSHLAHGLTGDYNKIPPLTAIVVDLYLYKLVR